MNTYVFVHGAWHGGWCWERVAQPLRARGHRVLSPTLTGLAERAHTLTRETSLSTHVEDIVRFIEWWDLSDVTLVGHSYAGLVLAGVAKRMPQRLGRTVFIDAFVPKDGESAFDLLPEQVTTHMHELVREHGDGWKIPPRPLEILGVTDPADRAWLEPRLTPQPLRSYQEPCRAPDSWEDLTPLFIECTDWIRAFQAQAQRAAERGWPIRQVATGHEAMVTAPSELATILDDLE